MEPLQFAGRLLAITGAGSGIGRAIALEAANRGMSVALADIDEAGTIETLAQVEARGSTGIAQAVDVRDADALQAFAHAAIERFGAPAVVFANAGLLKYGTTLRPDLPTWRRAVDVNLIGTVNTIDAFMGRMIDEGKPSQFAITGSMGSFVAASELAPYTATKHALWALAQCLRMELGKSSTVGVSLLTPPRVDTPILAESLARTRVARGDAAADAVLGSAMTPAAIAECALDGVRDRRFYIAPQIEDVAPIIRQRIGELLDGGA